MVSAVLWKQCSTSPTETAWYQGMGLYTVIEYILEDISHQVYIVHVSDHHLHDGKNCSHH